MLAKNHSKKSSNNTDREKWWEVDGGGGGLWGGEWGGGEQQTKIKRIWAGTQMSKCCCIFCFFINNTVNLPCISHHPTPIKIKIYRNRNNQI